MKSVVASARRSRSVLMLGGAGIAVVSLVGMAAPASAAGVPPPTPQTFVQCPVDAFAAPVNKPVSTCVVGTASVGSLVIGSLNTTFRGPGIVNGAFDGNAPGANWAPALNGQSFSAPRQLLPKPVLALLGNPSGVTPPANSDVWVVVRQAGPILFTIFNGGLNPTLTIPLSFHMVNSLLGSNCYVGSPTNPIVLTLQTGTSGALTGTLGQLVVVDNGNILQTVGTEVVDGLFTVPAATGCGNGDVWDNAINTTNNLPSASGANQAILYGNFALAAANFIEKQLHE